MLITRWKRESLGTGFSTGAPSIGTRIAGELLVITTGGALLTATVGGLMPASASDASSRSSDIDFISLATCACRSAVYAAPLFGSAGKSILVIFRSSNTTVRRTLSTWVRAVTLITPKVSSLAPEALMADAARKSIWLSVQLLICG